MALVFVPHGNRIFKLGTELAHSCDMLDFGITQATCILTMSCTQDEP